MWGAGVGGLGGERSEDFRGEGGSVCVGGARAWRAVPPLIVDACAAGLDAQQSKALRAGLVGKARALPNGAGRTFIAARCAAAHASLERSVLAVAPSARAGASLQAALADLGASSLVLPEAEALDAARGEQQAHAQAHLAEYGEVRA